MPTPLQQAQFLRFDSSPIHFQRQIRRCEDISLRYDHEEGRWGDVLDMGGGFVGTESFDGLDRDFVLPLGFLFPCAEELVGVWCGEGGWFVRVHVDDWNRAGGLAVCSCAAI